MSEAQESVGTRALRDMVREVVLDAHPNGDIGPAVERLMRICSSVHQNAHAYGVVLGRHDALLSVVEHLHGKAGISVQREIAALKARLAEGEK